MPLHPPVLSVVPARMGSSRFPGKPLALINGKPMIFYVLENCINSSFSSQAVVATPDQEIYDAVASSFSEDHVIYTSSAHERASDRAAEALILLERKYQTTYDIVNMVQGDEPCISPSSIDRAISCLFDDPNVSVVNLASRILSESDIHSLNTIKLVVDINSNAIYFSRSPIPSNTRQEDVSYYKQVCCIPFRRESLLFFNELPETNLEKAESVDMLRLIENNIPIKICRIDELSHPVDTPSDLEIVESILSR